MHRTMNKAVVATCLLTCLLATLPAAAAPPATNPYCRAHHLRSFVVDGVDSHPEPVDYCALPEESAPDAVRAALRQVVSLHREVAAAFGVAPAALFGNGLAIKLSGGAFGPVASYASSTRITQGVFPDWPRGEPAARPLNEAIYLHELGHVISKDASNGLPDAIHALAQTLLFEETFADSVALAVAGRVISATPALPSCLVDLRIISGTQSYGAQAGYFDTHFSARRMWKCCDLLRSDAYRAPHSADFCGQLEEMEARSSLPRFDRGKFDPRTLHDANREWDPHQIGLPLNSFLQALAKGTGRTLPEFYFPLFRDLPRLVAKTRYTCSAPKLGNDVPPREIDVHTFADVFQALRASLNGAEQGLFDRLWAKHRMDLGMLLSETDTLAAAALEARADWLTHMLRNDRPGLSRSHACLESFQAPSSVDAKDPGCRVTCRAR